MDSPQQITVRNMHLGLLWIASLAVPASQRAEWSREWRTELWYVLRECWLETSANPRSIRAATEFCLGAYQDAICVRKLSWQVREPRAQFRSSAAACLLLLIGIFVAAWALAQTSTRVAIAMSKLQVYPRQLTHTDTAPCDCPSDLSFQPAAHLFFDGFSHYTVTQQTVWSADMPRTRWIVAQASSDFFQILHTSVRPTVGNTRGPDREPRVLLSHDTWARNFDGKPNKIGAKLHVGTVDAIVVGVVPFNSTDLPGSADAWLLGSDSEAETSKSDFIVAHLSPLGYLDDGRWGLSVGGILLGFLLFPFVSRVSIGEFGSGLPRPSLAKRARFWAFLFGKISVLVPIAYYMSVNLGCLLMPPFSTSSACIQFASSVALCVWGLRWAFRDQQRRCPICLRRMTYPVEVGEPSRTFLAWNGTELMCERGHTLLHVPEIHTSWFGKQRWTCLDGSWQFLFARSNG
jgi:hypothetical protein